MLIIDFGGKKDFLEATQKQAIELLKKYANADDFESAMVSLHCS